MRSFGQLALLALPLLGRVACGEPAPPSPTKQTENVAHAIYANANEAFQDLLNALPEESLHVALNSLSHFRDGVFESPKRGVEHIHQGNPPLATKLIVAAVQDLKKRQQAAPSNGTVPSTQTQEPQTSSPPESSPPPESSENTPESTANAPQTTDAPAPQESSAVVIPVSVETTDAEGRPTVVSGEILSRPTASIVVPVTRVNSQGQTEVATETKPAVIFSTTDSAGSAIVTTAPVEFAPTRGQVLTRTDEEGSTFVTTYTPGSGRVSSIKLITTTGADGKQSVVTTYMYVDPAATEAPTDAEEPGSTAKPSLQRAGAPRYRAVDAAMLGGAIGGVLAIFT